MRRFHVVKILWGEGYILHKSFFTFFGAAAELMTMSRRIAPAVIRDGRTGRRLSYCEVEHVLGHVFKRCRHCDSPAHSKKSGLCFSCENERSTGFFNGGHNPIAFKQGRSSFRPNVR